MKIGFDAKRLFMNTSGLGNYSRNNLLFLAEYFPENEYHLYTPRASSQFAESIPSESIVHLPEGVINNKLKGLWRSWGISDQVRKDQLDLFHGLSNELPFNIQKSKTPSIITIHDLIYYRYPQFFSYFNRNMLHQKSILGCKNANHIIAVSEQSKQDIMDIYKTREEKISVVYQSCHPIYFTKPTEDFKRQVAEKYQLPSNFILSVGSIEARKNALSIVKALVEQKMDTPLVLAGRATAYTDQIKDYIEKNNLQKQVTLLHNASLEEIHALYHLAGLFVYPSFFEGFGIPIIEALASNLPVITTRGGCFPEAGGSGTVYIDPFDVGELGAAIQNIWSSPRLQEEMRKTGNDYVQRFSAKSVASNLMEVYQQVVAK